MTKKNKTQGYPFHKPCSGDRIGELSPKEALMKFAKGLNYVPNKGLAKYLIYGDEPEENWEEPLPSWVNELPDGPALKKLEK